MKRNLRTYACVAEQFASRTWTSAQIEQKQADELRRLIAYAAEHSPFHRRRLEKLNLGDLYPSDLSLLPIMTKADMMASLDEVFTDRRLSRRIVEPALADTGPKPNVILEQYVSLASFASAEYSPRCEHVEAGLRLRYGVGP
jgi:hypothetical protein